MYISFLFHISHVHIICWISFSDAKASSLLVYIYRCRCEGSCTFSTREPASRFRLITLPSYSYHHSTSFCVSFRPEHVSLLVCLNTFLWLFGTKDRAIELPHIVRILQHYEIRFRKFPPVTRSVQFLHEYLIPSLLFVEGHSALQIRYYFCVIREHFTRNRTKIFSSLFL